VLFRQLQEPNFVELDTRVDQRAVRTETATHDDTSSFVPAPYYATLQAVNTSRREIRMDDQDKSDPSGGYSDVNLRRSADMDGGAQSKARESARNRRGGTRSKRTTKQRKGVLLNAARAIGSALGKVAAKTSQATALAKSSKQSEAAKKRKGGKASTQRGVTKKAGAARKVATRKAGSTRKAGVAKNRKARG
jgi:hypothetical protein